MNHLRPSMWMAVAVVALLASCSEADPLAPRGSVGVDFNYALAELSSSMTTRVLPGTGEIVVQGSVVTGQHGYTLEPVLSITNTYVLAIQARRGTGISVPAHYRYEARIRNLEPGRHRVVVRHEFPDDENRDVGVVETVVDVR